MLSLKAVVMTRPTPELLYRYSYDPLDRLAGCSPLDHLDTHCFYRRNRLSTVIQGTMQTSWLQTPDLLLAQQRLEASHRKGALLATDAPGSVVHALSDEQQQGFAYLPYGMRHPDSASLPLPGFNGERLDPVTGHYLLGNGYRAFNPVLMRFNSPDSLSPFGEGELNAYAYCAGDPVNRVDPTGRTWRWVKALLRPVKLMKPSQPIPKAFTMLPTDLTLDINLLAHAPTDAIEKTTRFINKNRVSPAFEEAVTLIDREKFKLYKKETRSYRLVKAMADSRQRYKHAANYPGFVRQFKAATTDRERLMSLQRLQTLEPGERLVPDRLNNIVDEIRFK